MYQIDFGMTNYVSDENIAFYEQQLKTLNPNLPQNKSEYVELKTSLEQAKLIKQYGDHSTWQGHMIDEKLYPLMYQINSYEYGLEEFSSEQITQVKEQYDTIIQNLQKNDWMAFAIEERDNIEKELVQTKDELDKAKANKADTKAIEALEEQRKTLEISKQVANWRIDKKINYEESYFNHALNIYESGMTAIRNYEKENGNKEYAEKLMYYQSLQDVNIAKYDIEHQTTSAEATDGRGILLNVFSEFQIFIIIATVLIAGPIISEEFSKGTIKLLLIKPYKRMTILTAKLITCILVLFFVMISIVLMQLIVGGIVTGFEQYQTPAVVYDYNSHQVCELSIPHYLFLVGLAKLPIFFLLMVLAFAISTILNNTALSVAIPLLGYMGSGMINLIATHLKAVPFQFWITLNWDLSQYLFGKLPEFEYIHFSFSLIIILVYFTMMIIPTYLVFQKKNIKNI